MRTTAPQPTTTEPERHPRLPAEHIYLTIAAVAATIAAAAWSFDPDAQFYRSIGLAMLIVAGVSGCGYLVRSTETKVLRGLERKATDASEASRRAYAAGFVDAATGRGGDGGQPPRLRPVK